MKTINKTKLFVTGGFLGAGKTTSILNIAKHLSGKGKKIAIVTNDQGSDLVDTNFLHKSGLPVLEVTGGCFCCNFGEFTEKVNQLSEDLMPDLILAEPVGSCTDLIATIFKPIQQNFTKQFALGPLSIVTDPKRVKRLMMEQCIPGSNDALFPSEINYLFRKQLEEADIIVINKIDTLSQNEIEDITVFLKKEFKDVKVITASAKDGIGIEDWISLWDNFEATTKSSLNIDYDKYAKAEEYLGWLNSSVILSSEQPHDGNKFITSFLQKVKAMLSLKKMEIAHLKAYEVSADDWAKASITSILESIDFNKLMEKPILKANLIINARVNTAPETLEPIIADALKETCSELNITAEYLDTQCFKPGRPQPVYRID